ncbi:MAG: DJ-1/PfpI family protein [Theionarchaea archaeon]|nr:DJ-1/PfpI family protein [Theionarchaea archaeon]
MKCVKVDFLIFPNVEELDVIGPFEVFGKINDVTDNHCELSILAPTNMTVCSHGLCILRTHPLDPEQCGTILVVPGGKGAREPSKERSEVVDFLCTAYTGYEFILSVCTGTFLLDEAGLLKNTVCTTHSLFQEELKKRGHIIVPYRVVHHGNLITCTGVTSGIDASLYAVSLVVGTHIAEKIVQRIEYPFSVNQILEMVHVISADDQEML